MDKRKKHKFVRFLDLKWVDINCDMHLHTSRTDGKVGPTAIMQYAVERGLGKIAFTEHVRRDTNWFHEFAAELWEVRETYPEIEVLIGCETKDVTGQMVSCITTTADADRLLVADHVHRGAAAAGGANWMEIVGGDGITIVDPWVDGNFSVACIQNVTTAMTNFTLFGSGQAFFRTRNAADVILTCVATSTGNVGPNINARLTDDAANITEAFVGADMQFFQPINIANADGEVGMQTNISASTDA